MARAAQQTHGSTTIYCRLSDPVALQCQQANYKGQIETIVDRLCIL